MINFEVQKFPSSSSQLGFLTVRESWLLIARDDKKVSLYWLQFIYIYDSECLSVVQPHLGRIYKGVRQAHGMPVPPFDAL
jgi:hypothetical protein